MLVASGDGGAYHDAMRRVTRHRVRRAHRPERGMGDVWVERAKGGMPMLTCECRVRSR
jgi:hypothetical protein